MGNYIIGGMSNDLWASINIDSECFPPLLSITLASQPVLPYFPFNLLNLLHVKKVKGSVCSIFSRKDLLGWKRPLLEGLVRCGLELSVFGLKGTSHLHQCKADTHIGFVVGVDVSPSWWSSMFSKLPVASQSSMN